MDIEIKRKFNWLYIFQQGYGLIALPLNLFSFATTTYYLMINNIGFLKNIFPEYWIFLAFGGFFGIPAVFVIGTFYVKSEVFKGSQKINPYSYIILPKEIPLYEAVAGLCEKNGEIEIAEKLRKVIEVSR